MLSGRRKFIVIGVALGLVAALAVTFSVASGKEATPTTGAKLAQAADQPEAPRRGCTACHPQGGIDANGKYSLLNEAQERVKARDETAEHPTVAPDGTALTFQTTADTCLQCHKPGTGDRAGKGAFAPLALRDIVHPAHMFSTAFKEHYGGNCFTCHNVAGDGTWQLLPLKVDVNEKGVPDDEKLPIPGALPASETW
ncbi:MAG: hypothetical protein M1531_07950 [Chloroflexi bacterium]|nr:hypothetical protein [Chloroflexota bacterium]